MSLNCSSGDYEAHRPTQMENMKESFIKISDHLFPDLRHKHDIVWVIKSPEEDRLALSTQRRVKAFPRDEWRLPLPDRRSTQTTSSSPQTALRASTHFNNCCWTHVHEDVHLESSSLQDFRNSIFTQHYFGFVVTMFSNHLCMFSLF